MLTTTDPRDLVQELTQVRDIENDLAADACYVADRLHDELYGKGGIVELLRPLIKEWEPPEPQTPLQTAFERLLGLIEVTDIGADIEAKGGEIYDRLDRACELLQASA